MKLRAGRPAVRRQRSAARCLGLRGKSPNLIDADDGGGGRGKGIFPASCQRRLRDPKIVWTPAFAGVTACGAVIIAGIGSDL